MENLKEQLKKSLKKLHEKCATDKKYVGMIAFGSSTFNNDSKYSDLDLLLIFNKNVKKQGCFVLNNKRINYRVMSTEWLSSLVDKYSQSGFEQNLLKNHLVIFENNEALTKILTPTKNKKTLTNSIKLKIIRTSDVIYSLKNSIETKSQDFYALYYEVLNYIHSLNQKLNKTIIVPYKHAYKVYTNEQFRNQYYADTVKDKLPDEKFMKLFAKCMLIDSDKEKMLSNITNLFNHVTKELDFNPENYEIDFTDKKSNNKKNSKEQEIENDDEYDESDSEYFYDYDDDDQFDDDEDDEDEDVEYTEYEEDDDEDEDDEYRHDMGDEDVEIENFFNID